jgi:hypothetical protein
VHAYIADQIAKKAGWKNVNGMYGAMAPDVINYMFYSPNLAQMYMATHLDFEALWNEAGTPQERTLAYGFVGGRLHRAHREREPAGTLKGLRYPKGRNPRSAAGE